MWLFNAAKITASDWKHHEVFVVRWTWKRGIYCSVRCAFDRASCCRWLTSYAHNHVQLQRVMQQARQVGALLTAVFFVARLQPIARLQARPMPSCGVPPSLCMSRSYNVSKRVKHILQLFSPSGSRIIVVFSVPNLMAIFRRIPPKGRRMQVGYEKGIFDHDHALSRNDTR